jgi:hypothetical protein
VGDVKWVTGGLERRIRNWRVAEAVETLSDHLYVLMELRLRPLDGPAAASDERTVLSRRRHQVGA